jgi:uncharacterized membrane protein YciS (DUF1049 family)
VVRLLPLVVAVVVLGLFLIALVLPSKRDTSVAAWWTRIQREVGLFIRSLIALVFLAAIAWFVLLRLIGWR